MYGIVKKAFKKEGYTLLSSEYINTTTKLTYLCNHNEIKCITWAHFKEGRRCNCNAKNKKLTYSHVKDSFEKNGYKLLTTDYKNNHTKLHYVCDNGHEHSIIWANWNKGHRCPICAGQAKPTIDQIKELFEKEGYTLLSTEYKNAHTHLDYICPEGHGHSMSCTNWKMGFRCPTCWNIRNNGPGASNWQGGKSFEVYCQVWKDHEYKADIKARDGNRCLNPYCLCSDGLLHIHHINYNKQDCHPKNLITVCRSCNSKANYDRKWHKAWYQAIMYRRYNYNY